MKNNYEVSGEVTRIFLTSPKYGNMETLIDTADFEKVNGFLGNWCAYWSIYTKSFYVIVNIKVGVGKWDTIRLHRLLMDTPKGLVVDHINHKTLDNRRSVNLRNVTTAENMQNLMRARSSSKTGILGVFLDKSIDKYRSQIKINGKMMYLGTFHDIAEAEKAVIEARKTYMPFSQENIAK